MSLNDSVSVYADVDKVVVRPSAFNGGGAVTNVNGQSGVVILDADDVGAYSNTNPSGYVNTTGAANAAPVQSVTGTLVTGTSFDPIINMPTASNVGAVAVDTNGSSNVLAIWGGTQAEYNNIATPTTTTLYVITA
jgi:hypothetical protein